MEAGTVGVVETTTPQHMEALAKAMRRKVEIANLKRDIASGRLTAAAALDDPRAVGAVTLGTVLIAQRSWGRKRTPRFMARIGAPSTVLAIRVEKLTERQKNVLRRGLADPHSPLKLSEQW